MEFTLEVWCSNEFVSSPPLVRVSLDEATVERINEMQRVAIAHDLDAVSVRSYLPEYGYVSISTGWQPVFLLIRSARSKGSSVCLEDSDQIIGHKHRTEKRYKPL